MLIGLHGRAGSGKDTVCEYIKEWAAKEDRLCRRDAFADRLKVSAARALGYDGTPEECIARMNVLKEKGEVITLLNEYRRQEITGREYLQRYGTEAHREVFNDSFWVDACLPVQYDYTGEEILVITDCRFPNEAERIHVLGGVLWEVTRPGDTIKESGHASEAGPNCAKCWFT
jgi:hypothetical protein